MKAITIWEPWASLIAHGIKREETRTWAPPVELIGQRIAIHAAKRRVNPTEWPEVMGRDLQEDWPEGYARCLRATRGEELSDDWPYGCLIATAVLTSVSRVLDHRHDYGENPWAHRSDPSPSRSRGSCECVRQLHDRAGASGTSKM